MQIDLQVICNDAVRNGDIQIICIYKCRSKMVLGLTCPGAPLSVGVMPPERGSHLTGRENKMSTQTLTTTLTALSASPAATRIEDLSARFFEARDAGDNIQAVAIHQEIWNAYHEIAAEDRDGDLAPAVEQFMEDSDAAAAEPVTRALEDAEEVFEEADAPLDRPLEAVAEAEALAARIRRVADRVASIVEVYGELDDAARKPFAEAYDRLYDSRTLLAEIAEEIVYEQEAEVARADAALTALAEVREAYAAAHAETSVSPEEWAEDAWPYRDVRSIESDEWADAIYPSNDRSAADFQIYLPTDGGDFWAIARRAEHNLVAMGYGEKGFDPTTLIEEIR